MIEDDTHNKCKCGKPKLIKSKLCVRCHCSKKAGKLSKLHT